MESSKNGVKKVLKYIFRGIKIILITLLILFAGLYIYVSVNKKKIIAEVTSVISKKINGNVTIGDVDLSFFKNFPKIAVRLNDVKITDTMFSAHHHAFFEAKEVFLLLSISRLIRKQPPVNGLRVEQGSVYFYTSKEGYTNTYLLKPKTDTTGTSKKSSPVRNALESIRLSDVHFVLNDQQKEKLHDLAISRLDVNLNDHADNTELNVDASILVNSLAFNLPRGGFIRGKSFTGDFDVVYDKKLNQLQFDSINIRLQRQSFNMSGKFDLGRISPQFSLRIHTRKADYQEVRSFLPERISRSLSIVGLDKPLDADAIIDGPLNGGDPRLNVAFFLKNTHLTTTFMDFDHADFTGMFTNEVTAGLPRLDPNSKILVTNFKAEWHGLPVTAKKIEIMDLSHPLLTADISSAFELVKLNELLGSSALQLKAGNGSIVLKYQGPIERNTNTNSFLDGNIDFKNGEVLYEPRNVELKNLNGALSFKNSDLFIQNLQANVLGNSVVMNGVAKNLLTLINTEPNKVNIDWNIFSPSLDLGAFTFLLKQRTKIASGNKNTNRLSNVSDKIDNALEQSTLNVNLKVNRLIYKKFEASNVAADIGLLQDRYNIRNVSMNHAGGTISMNGALLNTSGANHSANISAALNNVDVSRLFLAFDNFGQDGITSASLEGKLTAKLTAGMQVDDNGKILPSSVNSVVDFSLTDGALNNYEPIKKIQSFIFKKRDFENIRFAELKDKLEISNQDIKINRMEIQSSVLSLFVEGVYSNRGNTDISIQVPLNNLKKRDEDYVPENIGVTGKTGRSLFIRGQPGADGNIKFKLDLFQKYKKDKTRATP